MRTVALVFAFLAIFYVVLAIVFSARDYGESIKQERQERIEKYESMLHRECAAMWPLRREQYKKCKGEV